MEYKCVLTLPRPDPGKKGGAKMYQVNVVQDHTCIKALSIRDADDGQEKVENQIPHCELFEWKVTAI